MALLTYKQYSITKMTAEDLPKVRQLLQTEIPKDRLDRDRLVRKASKIADYILSQEHSYVVKDDKDLYGVVCFDVDNAVKLEYLYSTKKHYNVPVGVLMNYVLNHVFPDVKVVCESNDVATFESIVEPLPKITGMYVVKDTFKEFVKRYEDGQ